MARWALTGKNYLAVEGVDWEYRETGNTGRQVKRSYPVPQYLDPDDPQDHTHKELGQIIVAHAGTSDPRDLIFTGPPTPQMEPLDDEAEAITAEWRPKWEAHPIESLPAQGELLAQIAAVAATSKPVSAAGDMVPREEFEALKLQLATLTEQTALRGEPPVVRR